jgi:NADH-quinone oxidoreductase subunit F
MSHVVKVQDGRKVLHRIENGHGREEDIDLLWSIQSKIEGNTICPLGDAAS